MAIAESTACSPRAVGDGGAVGFAFQGEETTGIGPSIVNTGQLPVIICLFPLPINPWDVTFPHLPAHTCVDRSLPHWLGGARPITTFRRSFRTSKAPPCGAAGSPPDTLPRQTLPEKLCRRSAAPRSLYASSLPAMTSILLLVVTSPTRPAAAAAVARWLAWITCWRQALTSLNSEGRMMAMHDGRVLMWARGGPPTGMCRQAYTRRKMKEG